MTRVDYDGAEPELRVRRRQLQHPRPDGSRPGELDACQV